MANYTRFQLRGDTKANWLSVNPILAEREPALETDTNRFKIGDGVSTYSQLSYGRNTSEYASLYNVTSLYPLPSGFYEHSTAILAVPSGERILGLIITYETASGVWYTERFIGTDIANWGVAANWEKLPDDGDLAQLRSDLNEMENEADYLSTSVEGTMEITSFNNNILIALDGVETVATLRLTTDFIKIKKGDVITWDALQGSPSYKSVAFYDIDKIFIPGAGANGAAGSTVAPSEAFYVKFSAYNPQGSAHANIRRYSQADYLNANMSTYTCYTVGATSRKAVYAPLFSLSYSSRFVITFKNKNTADDATLLMGSTIEKPLYYNGLRASSLNTWEADELVDMYYNGDSFYGFKLTQPTISQEEGDLSTSPISQVAITKKNIEARNRISLLESNLINGLSFLKKETQWSFGAMLYDGTLSSNTDYRISSYIPVKAFKRYKAIGSKGSSAWVFLSAYDANKNYVQDAIVHTEAIVEMDSVEFSVPYNIAYVRVSYTTIIPNVDEGLYELVDSTIDSISDLHLSQFGKYEIKRLNLINNIVIQLDGTGYVSTARLTSNYIKVESGDMLAYDGLQGNPSYLSVACYDSNLEPILSGSSSNVSGQMIFPDDTKYIRLSAQTNISVDIPATLYRINRSIGFSDNKGILDGLAIKSKLVNRTDDVVVLVIGDSLSAFHNQAPLYNQANSPCQMSCRNWVYNVWKYVNDIEIEADRFDSAVNPFTEVGVFDNGESLFGTPTLPYWTADAMSNGSPKTNGSITRYSNSANASIAFNWNLDQFEKLHFIHRLDYRAADMVTITIADGNGRAQVYDDTTSTWVEANGYQFSQKIAQSAEGSGYAQTLSNWRLKFKKATSATGTISMTFTASGSGYLFYWGVEKWNGNRIIFVNSSRGGREVSYFQDVVLNDIVERKPDLILLQAMLINEYGDQSSTGHTGQNIVNHFRDFIFGDRVGFENVKSLKNLSNNWSDFQAVCIIPQVRYEYFSTDYEFKKYNLHDNVAMYMDNTAPIVWNQCKSMINAGGLQTIDIYSAFKMEADKMGITHREAYKPFGIYSTDGFTMDGVHNNVLGSFIYGRYIATLFNII